MYHFRNTVYAQIEGRVSPAHGTAVTGWPDGTEVVSTSFYVMSDRMFY